ncbi:MAG TPA: hypothetical protein VF516_20100 [Kofleriaceae bacterium]
MVWTSLVNTTVSGDVITKTGGQPWAEDAGAVSQQSIASGDAALQFTIDETSRFRFIGFAHTSDWHAANMDYSFRMQAGHADVYEHNTWQANILIAVGDVMKIDVVGGVAHYYKNGVLQYTSAQAPVYPLGITTSMIDGSSTIASARISASGNAVTWVGQVNTTVTGTVITKTGGQPWAEDAGAVSQQSIASGDGWFQFTIDETSRFRFVGFAHTTDWHAANMDYSFRMQAGHADVYEHNTWQANILIAVGDVMKVDITGGVARYYKNGALQFTSAQAPAYPLWVTTSMIDGSSTIASAQMAGAGTPPGNCGSGPFGGGAWPPGCWRPYATTSPFNTPLPASPRLRSDSAGIVNRMLHFTADTSAAPNLAGGTQAANMIAPSDHMGGWPTYYGRASDPVYTVTCSLGANCSLQANHIQFHAPAGAERQGGAAATSGQDRHMTIVDQTTGNEIDLWQVDVAQLPAGGGTISTSWSGYTRIDGDGRAIGPGEGTAARIGNIAGRIRYEELAAGVIDHAISIVVNCDNGTAVYPADTPNGQHCTDPSNAPPLGARFRLNMTWDQINALPVPEWKKVVLRAMSKYGAFMNDTGSSFYFDWQTESGNQYTSQGAADPWLSFGAAHWGNNGAGYTGTWHDNDDGINWRTQVWANLQVVDACVSNGGC